MHQKWKSWKEWTWLNKVWKWWSSSLQVTNSFNVGNKFFQSSQLYFALKIDIDEFSLGCRHIDNVNISVEINRILTLQTVILPRTQKCTDQCERLIVLDALVRGYCREKNVEAARWAPTTDIQDIDKLVAKAIIARNFFSCSSHYSYCLGSNNMFQKIIATQARAFTKERWTLSILRSSIFTFFFKIIPIMKKFIFLR